MFKVLPDAIAEGPAACLRRTLGVFVARAMGFRDLVSSLATLVLLLIWCPDARAVPSFTRQTGLACTTCHSNPPELTAFGRKFKLEGYTVLDRKPGTIVEAEDLKLLRSFPLSVMLLTSATVTNKPVPGSPTLNVQFPQALSLFLAGEIAPHLGGMVQATYSHQSDHITLDNTDVRYARHTTLGKRDLLIGVTLNNNPTVEDVWNSTPAWGYPWLSANNAPSPSAAPIVAGALAQDVAGLGAYTLWDDHLYAAVTLYRSEHAGGPQPLTGTNFDLNIHGVALYWRVAWQQTWGLNYLEVGTYGIYLSSVPSGVSGPRNTYLDTALDLQYERPFGVDLLSFHATYLHEHSDLDATVAGGGATAASHRLSLVRADATYHLRSRYTFTLAGFSSNGSADPLLFAPAPITGSQVGRPDSTGFSVQTGYWPKQNIELLAAYTGYKQFNGSSRDYDGSGRAPSANNTLYFALWLNY